MPGIPLALEAAAVASLTTVAAREALVWSLGPVDDRAWRASQRSRTWLTIVWILLAFAAGVALGIETGAALAGGAYLLVRVSRAFFEWRYGGLPGWGASAASALFAAFSFTVVALLHGLW